MSAIRESFVARFGEDNAAAIERAAEGHRHELLDGHKVGDDPFVDCLSICIDFECMGRFASAHGIAADESKLQAWALEVDAFNRHVGPIGWLGLLTGAYKPWVRPEHVEAGDAS